MESGNIASRVGWHQETNQPTTTTIAIKLVRTSSQGRHDCPPGEETAAGSTYIMSSDGTGEMHLRGRWLAVGRDTCNAAPKEVVYSLRSLCPGSYGGCTEVALCRDVTEGCSN